MAPRSGLSSTFTLKTLALPVQAQRLHPNRFDEPARIAPTCQNPTSTGCVQRKNFISNSGSLISLAWRFDIAATDNEI